MVVVFVLAVLFGLYFSGARHISPDWRPRTAHYPESARLALWRSYSGEGVPEGNPMSPPEFAWRWYRAGSALMDGKPIDPRMVMAGRAARIARFMALRSPGESHLMEAAASIRASTWTVEQQLDTVLDNAYFAQGVRGFRQGAMHVFGRPVEQLDAAQLHVLLTLDWAPSYLCNPERLRKLAATKSSQWRMPVTTQELDAALATIGRLDQRCSGSGD
jgi:hypothetical protein